MNIPGQPLQLCAEAGWEKMPLPADMVPTRAIVTANCLLALEHAGGLFVIAHNADPVNWNTWFPPYVHHDWTVPSGLETRGAAVAHVQQHMSAAGGGESKAMWDDLTSKLGALFPTGRIALEERPFVPVDYWLKYSRSSGLWTVYGFVWYAAKRVHVPGKITSVESESIALIPFGERQWRGRPVVENLVTMMTDARVAERLKKVAVKI